MTRLATAAPEDTTASLSESQATIVFAGGGSGGHIAPALAIHERMNAQPIAGRFICSTRAIDQHMLGHAGVDYQTIDAAPLSIKPRGLAKFAVQLPRATRQATRLLEQWNADLVLGMGGFVAAPVVRAAKQLKLPAILMNLDRPPGKANRLMARWADEVWTAIDLGPSSRFATHTVGPPVRRVAMADREPARCRAALGLDPDTPTLLVTGASQGATSINRLIAGIVENHRDWLDGWQILHLAGRGESESMQALYDRAGVLSVARDFIDEIGLAWGAADLAISRAGANSVAEVAANAVPTVFLPYPHHRDDHQRFNAEPLVKTGGCVLLEDRIEPAATLAEHAAILRSLLTEPSRLRTMKEAMVHARPRDAADTIARMLADRIGLHAG